jgi:hypothetical protein
MYSDRDIAPTFKSVILAGVYDIGYLKMRIRPEAESGKLNSPWNIAADFGVELSLRPREISSMLVEYENDHHTGMDIDAITRELFDLTQGYPFLVSKMCSIIDSGISVFIEKEKAWSLEGVNVALNVVLKEKNRLFESIIKNLHDFPNLRERLEKILFAGEQHPYSDLDLPGVLGVMFGFLKQTSQGMLAVSNSVFERYIYSQLLSLYKSSIVQANYNQFIVGNMLQMDLVMEKFLESYEQIYGDVEEQFLEEHGVKIFMAFLRPIINGSGNMYIEAQTVTKKRADLIAQFLWKRFIVEMKIWHGASYNADGIEQLLHYMDKFGLDSGWLLSFSFNKQKKPGIKESIIKRKRIVEVLV